MALSDVCTSKNFAWETELASAFHYRNEDGEVKTVFRYQVPLPPEKEAIFMAKYDVAANDRLSFYQNLVRCIQREVAISDYLTKAKVSSILTFSAVEQERDEKGVSYIYLETEQVWPVMKKLLTGAVPAITVLDVIYRLAVVLRDLGKEDVGVVHRGLDLNKVYINQEEKLKVGGFFYADCPGLGSFPDYLPTRPVNLPFVFLHGERGHQGFDLMTLSITAWNLLSGHPFDARLADSRLVFPAYATEGLVEALRIGMSGSLEYCNLFRRKLSDCRKQLVKTDYAQLAIPIRQQLLKEFVVEYIDH